jgi:DNA-binding NarL/FixJ family response regulator
MRINGSGGALSATPTQNGSILTHQIVSTPEHMFSRLVVRRYVEKTRLVPYEEFSIKLGHKGSSRYFPLGTDNEKEATLKAAKISQLIANHGWELAAGKFPYEFTVAVFWATDPLCCTYSTIYTMPQGVPGHLAKNVRPAPRRCRTIVVHPDELIRRALAFWIERQPGFQCTGQYARVTEAMSSVPATCANLLLVDRGLVECADGPSLKQICTLLPNLKVFGIGVYEESNYIFHSVTGIQSGYMLCRRQAHRLFEPIKLLGVNPGISRDALNYELMKSFQNIFANRENKTKAGVPELLTAREHDVLQGLARGQTEKQVAADLSISAMTVHNHVKNIYGKLDAHSRAEAVVKFLSM